VIKIEIDKFDENELKLFRKLNQTIQRVTKDIESLEYNTAIASIMELLNFMDKFENKETSICYYIVCKNIIKLIAPFAPHLGEELWNMTGEVETVFSSEWPIVNTEMLNEDMTMIVIQINGKVRDKFLTSSGQEEQEVIRKAIGRETVKKYLEYKTIIKRIYLKDKLINFVVK
jgi:leucyl-tRNA synthetase